MCSNFLSVIRGFNFFNISEKFNFGNSKSLDGSKKYSKHIFCASSRTSRVLSMGELQRQLSFARRSGPDADGTIRPDKVRPMHARRSRKRRLFGRRSDAPRPEVLRPAGLSHADTRRHVAQHPSVPEGTDALPGSQLSVRKE